MQIARVIGTGVSTVKNESLHGRKMLLVQTLDADLRHDTRLGTTGLLALRMRAFKSWGDVPDFIYFGGNSELRGYDYLEFLGTKAFFLNAELRFPLIEAALTPLGVGAGEGVVGVEAASGARWPTR